MLSSLFIGRKDQKPRRGDEGKLKRRSGFRGPEEIMRRVITWCECRVKRFSGGFAESARVK